ncbi:MYG1 family protein [Pontiella agarivorans]|uniref:MYG1 family protein n=1 Tax=Pontiella agarivorans TaxID=3038953 RepID=A0ABU5N213_9BACT|nr:MYG1 family protein [Pontiella agarivorans]MDZ8120494.1 MYG1 family protein [Pontiella agarivorans]
MKTILGTHSGNFHADDVFAVAALSILHPEYEIRRSRDPEVWAQCDYLVDVGGTYDHAEKKYDHHFKNGPTYDDGLKMSSIGLIWKHYGAEICGDSKLAEQVCKTLIRQFDAIDNGVKLSAPLDDFSDVREVSLTTSISMMNPDNPFKADDVFEGEVVRARQLLLAAISRAKRWIHSRAGLALALNEALAEKRAYIIVPENCKWQEHLFNSEGNESILYAVFSKGKKTFAQAVPSALGEYSNRKDFPQAWAGLMDDDFNQAAGISDGIFCHQGAFLLATYSFDSTLKLVEEAIKA